MAWPIRLNWACKVVRDSMGGSAGVAPTDWYEVMIAEGFIPGGSEPQYGRPFTDGACWWRWGN